MENIGDDLLGLILDKIDAPNDRKSFSLVCKKWLQAEGLHRSSIQVFDPDIIPDFLPRFPNILEFHSSVPMYKRHMRDLARTWPRIQVLNLTVKGDFYSLISGAGEIDEEGLREVAKGCPDLRSVLVMNRYNIGDTGVVSLVRVSRNLVNLDLTRCRMVSDKALESIGDLGSLEALNLQGCCFISDEGLSFLAYGLVSNTLRKLNLADCDRITDKGLIYLMKMACLEELNLAKCGSEVTDVGVEKFLAERWTLKKLDLAWLDNVGDASVVAIALKCQKLEFLDLTACDRVSGAGIRAISSNKSLRELVLIHCGDDTTTGDDLEEAVRGCSTLERIVVDKRLRTLIHELVQENILKRGCVLDWK